ncbi:hypothetical protein S40288_11498 [Stachybotrys chartarum IBT 40288]|nr:hypothetical protein S40288_11498 [Stachybotrys chartarum IBT 40288]
MLSFIYVLITTLAGVSAFNAPDAICIWEPSLTVSGGSVVSANLDNPRAGRCEATLLFSNDALLPISWSFAAIACVGPKLAHFTVPVGVWNGDAYLIWIGWDWITSGTQFIGWIVRGTEFIGWITGGTQFIGWIASGTQFIGWIISGTQFIGWIVSGTEFIGWITGGTQFIGWIASGTQFIGWIVSGTELIGWI